MNRYATENIADILANNAYPGRGIIIGKSNDAKSSVFAYFIMGRSENSRNRVFVKKDGKLYIYPFDESKLKDPSLIIYSPLREYENNTIVTNGDQTDTVYEYLSKGLSFEEALQSRFFEPDKPNYTPRISGMLTYNDKDFTYKLNILKCANERDLTCCRHTFSYPSEAGAGHFIHTYETNAEPLPSFCGEPKKITIPDDIDSFADTLWENLNNDNKISLYVRYTNLSSMEFTDRIYNKNV